MKFDRLYRNVALDLYRGKKSKRDICLEYGINEKTLYRWSQKPEFQEYYKNLELEFIKEARQIIVSNVQSAASELIRLMNESRSDETRRKAAEGILCRLPGLERRIAETKTISGNIVLDIKDRILLDGLSDKDRQAIIEAYQGVATYLRQKIRQAKEKEEDPGEGAH